MLHPFSSSLSPAQVSDNVGGKANAYLESLRAAYSSADVSAGEPFFKLDLRTRRGAAVFHACYFLSKVRDELSQKPAAQTLAAEVSNVFFEASSANPLGTSRGFNMKRVFSSFVGEVLLKYARLLRRPVIAQREIDRRRERGKGGRNRNGCDGLAADDSHVGRIAIGRS